ncbi:MAG: hypothetical protein QNK04_22025 [Myxococcota bacterium]|nr:hypothetical protein [Myxococcota bacterium]
MIRRANRWCVVPWLAAALAMGLPATLAGCAGGSSGSGGRGRVKDTSQFPSQKELEKLGETPAPIGLLELDVQPVDTWELAGPFPSRIEVQPYTDPESAWSQLLEDAARRRAGLIVPTEAMHCVAREFGRFYIEHRGQPTSSLQRFMTARCNAAVPNPRMAWVSGQVAEEVEETELFEQWKESVTASLRKNLKGGPQTAGIWFGRDDDHVVIMIAFATRRVHVDPVWTLPDGSGAVELRGEALGAVEGVSALINHGRFGVAECESIGSEPLPSFHLRCKTDPDDDVAEISLVLSEPGRLIGRQGLTVLTWPKGKTSRVYRRPSYAESWPMLAPENVPEDFVELLNGVRREAELEPVELDPVQSGVATELAPHFFAALYGEADEFQADIVVLGMLAGWEVEGIVQTGRFASALVMSSNDLADLLASALEHPSSRESLLAPDVERIAVGPMVSLEERRNATAALIGTYALFSEEEHDAMANRVYEKLEAERESRGKRSPRRLEEVDWHCREAASTVQAGEDTTDALDWLLERSVDVLGRSVTGWVAEVSEIEDLEFPEDYLTRPSLGVAVAVSHYLPKGEAWGRYVVMLVVSDPETRGV